jgi:hypothetical protein
MTGYKAMQRIERFLIGALVVGIWALVALHLTSISQTYAQENTVLEQENKATQLETSFIHASEIVGLSALIEKTIRDGQARPQSIPGLDQYIKSIVRGCRITGLVRDDRITSANISC